jgi:hypothetical protein
VEEVSPDRDERRARGRRFPTGLVLGVVLLAIIAAGGWWALQSRLVKLPGSTNVAGPGAQPSAGDNNATSSGGTAGPAKPGQADQGRNWVTVFSPSDPTQVTAPTDAEAKAMQDDTGSFLRVRSGPSGAPVTFNVGQGILEQVAGKHAVFDVIARAEEGKETQMSVNCDFGALGDCGRKRYAVGHERNEYLFDVQFPDKEPAAGGTIAIDSDFDKQGKSVDIYEIRVSVVPE